MGFYQYINERWEKIRSSGPATKARFLQPPDDIAMRVRSGEEFRPRKIGGMRENLWAGCKDYQTSADAYIDGDYHGAFTYHLVEALKSGSTIRSEIIERVRKGLSSGGYDQVPQLESANQGEPIFA